ncbi:tRNA (guanosine(46)-N7)-methyltransferase TrmB [Candidatus Ozemobacteraceae bacterium]|nr:tRNA (guanosine(46)-N7)-methyltransferase TrmB [Candidatus Ozemobacteraceae bacterium]OQA08362.1 MAG: tRNA (guanine-N(7)-)-methyltransferase [bacterium ADurb.Bin374]
MRVPKLERYRQLAAFPNLFEPPIRELLETPFERAGKWNDAFFRRPAPLILEMGCGWGDFSLGLARIYPAFNVLGLDVKGGRIWHGARSALEEKLNNVGFIRVEGELLEKLFAPGELDEIWVTFPTPYLRKPGKMLIAPTFLARYRTLLARNGKLNLLTDVEPIAEYARLIWPLCGFEIREDTDWEGLCQRNEAFSQEKVCTRFQARAIERNKRVRSLLAVPLPGVVKPISPEILRMPWGK